MTAVPAAIVFLCLLVGSVSSLPRNSRRSRNRQPVSPPEQTRVIVSDEEEKDELTRAVFRTISERLEKLNHKTPKLILVSSPNVSDTPAEASSLASSPLQSSSFSSSLLAQLAAQAQSPNSMILNLRSPQQPAAGGDQANDAAMRALIMRASGAGGGGNGNGGGRSGNQPSESGVNRGGGDTAMRALIQRANSGGGGRNGGDGGGSGSQAAEPSIIGGGGDMSEAAMRSVLLRAGGNGGGGGSGGNGGAGSGGNGGAGSGGRSAAVNGGGGASSDGGTANPSSGINESLMKSAILSEFNRRLAQGIPPQNRPNRNGPEFFDSNGNVPNSNGLFINAPVSTPFADRSTSSLDAGGGGGGYVWPGPFGGLPGYSGGGSLSSGNPFSNTGQVVNTGTGPLTGFGTGANVGPLPATTRRPPTGRTSRPSTRRPTTRRPQTTRRPTTTPRPRPTTTRKPTQVSERGNAGGQGVPGLAIGVPPEPQRLGVQATGDEVDQGVVDVLGAMFGDDGDDPQRVLNVVDRLMDIYRISQMQRLLNVGGGLNALHGAMSQSGIQMPLVANLVVNLL